MARKVNVGLALYQPCITDFGGLTTYTPQSSLGTALFTLTF